MSSGRRARTPTEVTLPVEQAAPHHRRPCKSSVAPESILTTASGWSVSHGAGLWQRQILQWKHHV